MTHWCDWSNMYDIVWTIRSPEFCVIAEFTLHIYCRADRCRFTYGQNPWRRRGVVLGIPIIFTLNFVSSRYESSISFLKFAVQLPYNVYVENLESHRFNFFIYSDFHSDFHCDFFSFFSERRNWYLYFTGPSYLEPANRSAISTIILDEDVHIHRIRRLWQVIRP